jgi:hypothetical protein
MNKSTLLLGVVVWYERYERVYECGAPCLLALRSILGWYRRAVWAYVLVPLLVKVTERHQISFVMSILAHGTCVGVGTSAR